MRFIRPSLICILLLSIISCGKDPDSKPAKPAFAGYHDSTYIFNGFPSGPVSLNPDWDPSDSNHVIKLGSDTLKLTDEFGSTNIIVSLRSVNQDSLSLVAQEFKPAYWGYLRLDWKEEAFRVVTVREDMYVGLGTTAHFYFAAVLNSGERIDQDDIDQENPAHSHINIWEIPPSNAPSATPVGPWLGNPHISYIGFMLHGKMGWIMLDNRDRDNPVFISYAIKQ